VEARDAAAAPASARDEILARVRAALSTARLPSAPEPPPIASSLERATPAEQRARFVAELKALNVVVHEEATPAALRARVAQIVGRRSVLAWPRSALPYELEPESLGTPSDSRPEERDVGLTGVDLAIAETGTLALVSSSDHPRTASLLPPVHVAVVRADQIVPTLGAAFARLGPAIPAASAINFVTGPSRTADIELQLTLGVHGPGELVVVLGP
jgi:L-lactate dehydrogenase complex protein LldG